MLFNKLFSICVLFPVLLCGTSGVLLCGNSGGQTILETIEKQFQLNKTYTTLWDDVAIKLPNECKLSSDCSIKLHTQINKNELLSALYERYVAMQLNVLCWRCALYYKLGKKKGFTDFQTTIDNKALQCALTGESLAWYNEKFSANMFLEAEVDFMNKKDSYAEDNQSTNAEQSKTNKATFSYKDIVIKIDNMLKELKRVNQIFIEADLKYDNIFQKLKNHHLTDQESLPIDKKEAEFLDDCFVRITKLFGKDYLDVARYMYSFLGVSEDIEGISNLIPDFADVKARFATIVATSTFAKNPSEINRILNFERELFKVPAKISEIVIPKNFVLNKDFDLVKQSEGWSDYRMAIVEEKLEVKLTLRLPPHPLFKLSHSGVNFSSTLLRGTSAGGQTMLKTIEKQFLLNKTYVALLDDVMLSIPSESKDSSNYNIELDMIDKNDLMAALYERYVAIDLNVLCWRCALYYKLGKTKGFTDLQKKSYSEVLRILYFERELFAVPAKINKIKIPEKFAVNDYYIIKKYEAFCGFDAVQEEQMILEIIEKQFILNKTYTNVWNMLTYGETKDWLHSQSGDIVLERVHKKELLSALHERYQAIQMNVLCWRCALYYKLGRTKGLTDMQKTIDEKARQCALMGESLSWYNETFSAKMFMEAHTHVLKGKRTYPENDQSTNAEESTSNKVKFSFANIVGKIDNMLKELKRMNQIFKEANLNYDGIFQKLKNEHLNEDESRPIEGKEKDFIDKCFIRLMKLFGEDYLYVTRYMYSFLGVPDNVEGISYSVPHWKDVKTQFAFILGTSTLAKSYSEIGRILMLERELFTVPAKVLKIKIPKNLSVNKDFNLIKQDQGWSDYKIEIIKKELEGMILDSGI